MPSVPEFDDRRSSRFQNIVNAFLSQNGLPFVHVLSAEPCDPLAFRSPNWPSPILFGVAVAPISGTTSHSSDAPNSSSLRAEDEPNSVGYHGIPRSVGGAADVGWDVSLGTKGDSTCAVWTKSFT